MQTAGSSNLRQENQYLKREVEKLGKELAKYHKLMTQREDKTASLKKLEVRDVL